MELGLIKRGGKQRIDSTHILGYVKEMSRLECATETVRLALEEMAGGLVGSQRPEFWERDVGIVRAERSGMAAH